MPIGNNSPQVFLVPDIFDREICASRVSIEELPFGNYRMAFITHDVRYAESISMVVPDCKVKPKTLRFLARQPEGRVYISPFVTRLSGEAA